VVRVLGYRSRGPGLDPRRYQIFWEVVGLGWGPLSLVSITEELLEWKSSGSGLENQDFGRGDPLRWPRNTLYPQKLALTSQTCGGRSVGIVRLWTKAMEFFFFHTSSKSKDKFIQNSHKQYQYLKWFSCYYYQTVTCNKVHFMWRSDSCFKNTVIIISIHCGFRLLIYELKSNDIVRQYKGKDMYVNEYKSQVVEQNPHSMVPSFLMFNFKDPKSIISVPSYLHLTFPSVYCSH
jgi:hypothetical protein